MSPSQATRVRIAGACSRAQAAACSPIASSASSSRSGIVVVQRERARLGVAAEGEHVVDDRVAPAALGRHVGGQVLRVVDDEAAPCGEARQLRRASVTRPGGAELVVGQVADARRAVVVVDAEALAAARDG